MTVFSKYVGNSELFLFLFPHCPTDILAEKILKPKDIITMALSFKSNKPSHNQTASS